MESGELRVFQAVAREGSITKAANRLGYVQSNVTARIQQLESELGTVLFYRHNRGMTLTPIGRTLLGYADSVLRMLDEAAKVAAASPEPRGPLVIGTTHTAAAVRLPKLLAGYHREYPDVQLSLQLGHSQFLSEKVLQYELDGAFVSCVEIHPDLIAVPAYMEEMVIVSEPLVTELQDALRKPVLVFSNGCSYREILEKWLHANGRSPSQIMEFGTLEAIIGGVSAGLGISMLPRAVIEKAESEGLVRSHPMEETISRAQTVFIRRKDAYVSSALEALLAALPK